MYSIKIMLVSLIFALPLTAVENDFDVRLSEKISRYLENAYAVEEVHGRFRLESGEVLQRNLLLVDAQAEISGTVEGNVVVVNGEISLGDEAEIYGDLVLVNAQLEDDGARILGSIIDDQDSGLRSPLKSETFGPVAWTFNERTGMSELQIAEFPQRFVFIHNRVQGFYFGLRWANILGNEVRWINLHASFGYGFSDYKWRYRFGARRAIGRQGPFYLGISAHDLVETNDNWKITEFENSISSVTFKEDFFDFYRRQGWQADISLETVPFKLRAGYRQERQNSARANATWALFAGGKQYRPNPVASEGNYRLLFVDGSWRTVDNPRNPHSGVWIEGGGESAFSQIGSEYGYNKAELTVSTFIPLSRAETLSFRAYGASLEGNNAPLQQQFRTGGIGTVRAYPLYSEVGNRSLLGTLEYKIRLDYFTNNEWLLGGWGFAVFTDAGSTRKVDTSLNWYEGFNNFHIDEWQNSVGLGFILGDEIGRIDIAKRTDGSADGIAAYARLKVSF
jgi:hypothetical protein